MCTRTINFFQEWLIYSRIIVEQQQKHIQVKFCMHYVYARTIYSKQDHLGLNLGPATYQLCDFQ